MQHSKTMEKPYKIKIRAYGYWTEFDVKAIDEAKSLEDAIVDKLGKNDIVWEKDGFIDSSKLWLTYEETIDANTSQGPLQTEEKSRDRMGGASA